MTVKRIFLTACFAYGLAGSVWLLHMLIGGM
jgi:hypothetical protein